MIGVDWGTSSLRVWRIGREGVLESRAAPRGIMTIADGGFESMLREVVADWLAVGETKLLLAGMIGSRQGWREAEYLGCPAGLDDFAARLAPVGFAGGEAMIVPGLAGVDASGVPEVMRGEEMQVLGAADRPDMLFCLPGTHSKWVRLEAGRIAGFSTYMTGEVFAALSAHTILARTLRPGAVDPAGFAAGLARAAEPGGLLHHIFGVRTLALRGGMAETAANAYLSGLLIGHELNAAFSGGEVTVIGADPLARLYAEAIAARGGEAAIIGEAAAASGLARLGKAIGWI
ncbi:MAG: 2-dehydro-3-deoxygalactonokinase [Acidiphilium sp.]